MSTVITRVELRYEQDVVYARYRARIIAEQLGFDSIDQTRISTAVSEIARNVFQYGGGGGIEFLIDTGREPNVFVITVRDYGKGIARLDDVLEGRYVPETGLGLGIIGAKRLMDHLHIDSRPEGTTVFLGKNLPLTAPQVTPALLARIGNVLAKTAARNPFEEIRLQNRDLIHALEALTESEERFQRAVSITEEGLWEWDILANKEFFSPRWCEILGYSPDDPELLHTFSSWAERIHPDDSGRVMSALKNHLEMSTKFDIDYQHRHKSGEYRWQNSKGLAIFDASGKPVKMIGVINDITERKKAEEILLDFNKKLQQGIEEKTAALRESELKHSILFESSQDAIMTLEPPDWRFTSGNPATLAMFRAKDETALTSAAPWDLSPECQPDGRPSGGKAKEMIENAMREGSYFYEWVHKRLDGEDFPATVLLTRFEWKGQKILQGTVRDITGQKRAEEELKNSERKFRAIFDQTFQFIGLMTPDGTLVEANRTAMEFSGIQESDVLGKPFWETPWWTHSGELQEKLRAAVLDAAKGEFVRFEATHMAADGRLHYVDFSLKPVKDEAGRVILLIPEGRDITEQKLAENQIKASLEEKVLLLREIHHRVRNNLQIIISLVNLQMRQIDDERLKQVMAETQNRVRAMSFVHEKLYLSEDISHIDLENYTRFLVTHLFSFSGVDSRQVAQDIDIGKIMLDIETAIPFGLIINELVSNALKHAFPNGRKGTLSITIREEGTTLYITVMDDGTGFPADFDWRNAESLGFQLVISLVKQLDGTIELDLNSGTAFTIIVQEKG